MKKLFLTTGLMFAFVGLAQAQLAAPTLLQPNSAANLPLKKAAKFTWQKVTGATKYRLLFSSDNSFKNYNATKFKCLNTTTCFLYTVASPSYNVAATHPMLKANGDYFWLVQAVGKTAADNSKWASFRAFSVGVPIPPEIQSVSANPQEITLGASTTINATLDRALAVGFYTIKISIDGGEPQSMTGSSTNFSFSYTPSEIGEQQFQIDILDVNGEVIDSNGDSFTVIAADVTKTTGYTKIANNGSVLADDAKLGANPTDWACTKDNNTGLIWEVKTTDGLRDINNNYSWYEPDATKNGGFAGYQNGGVCDGSDCNTYAFTNAVNQQGLCGAKDWRLPSIDELKGLLTTTNTINQPLNKKLYIDAMYFPNTYYGFWSSLPTAGSSDYAWLVGFDYGISDYFNKNRNYNVRLVR